MWTELSRIKENYTQGLVTLDEAEAAIIKAVGTNRHLRAKAQRLAKEYGGVTTFRDSAWYVEIEVSKGE